MVQNFTFLNIAQPLKCTEFREDRFMTYVFSFSFVWERLCFLFPKWHNLAHLQVF